MNFTSVHSPKTARSFAAIEKLDHLTTLGVTAIAGFMPVADFPGKRNWGYDGVLLYAPDSSYGRPEDLKALVEAAHARGLMVLLDVVYNHFGPDGNYLPLYAPQTFTNHHKTPWGDAINSTPKAAIWFASLPCTMHSIGWKSSTSMGCVSMQSIRSRTMPRASSG